MSRNRYKVALRVLFRYKVYSLINIVCLSVATAFCLFAAIYVKDELGRDKFHENGKNIYALYRMDFRADDVDTEPRLIDTGPLEGVSKSLQMSIPFTNEVKNNIPELESMVLIEYAELTVTYGQKQIKEPVKYVSESFFEDFSFEFVHGMPATALAGLDNVVISERVAQRYFGETDVIGEVFEVGDKNAKPYLVSGVVKEPVNSSISIDIVLRLEQSGNYTRHKDNWRFNSLVAFLRLKEGASSEFVAKKVLKIHEDRFGANLEAQRKALGLRSDSPVVAYGLKSFRKLYLDPTIRFGTTSSPLYSYILIGLSFLIVFIACLNYSAISVSLASTRAVEIMIRKSVGAKKSQLVSQFFTETFLVSIVAMLLGYSLMQVLSPLFTEITSKSVSMSAYDHMTFLVVALGIALLIAVLAGVYPAIWLANLNVGNGNKPTTHKVKPGLIQSMVVFQFMLGVFFIAMSITIHRQFKYINSKDLGFDKEQVVYLKNSRGLARQLRQAYEKEPSLIYAVGAGGIFDSYGNRGSLMSKGVSHTITQVNVGHDFFESLDLELVQGRTFDPALSFDAEAARLVVNESFYNIVKGDTLFGGLAEQIIGVVKDFHFESLSDEIEPLVFNLSKPERLSVMYVKLKAGMLDRGLEALKRGWEAVAPDREYEYRFLDEYLASNYKSGRRWGRIMDVSSVLAVIIAASGLFGLTGITIMNKTREIGIRKVLGANLGSLLLLLNRQTVWLVLVASALSFPAWVYFSEQWLGSYAYHMHLGGDVFIYSVIFCLLIVLAIAAFHGMRTSRMNPVNLLRDE